MEILLGRTTLTKEINCNVWGASHFIVSLPKKLKTKGIEACNNVVLSVATKDQLLLQSSAVITSAGDLVIRTNKNCVNFDNTVLFDTIDQNSDIKLTVFNALTKEQLGQVKIDKTIKIKDYKF